jgi:hypothetical protein
VWLPRLRATFHSFPTHFTERICRVAPLWKDRVCMAFLLRKVFTDASQAYTSLIGPSNLISGIIHHGRQGQLHTKRFANSRAQEF